MSVKAQNEASQQQLAAEGVDYQLLYYCGALELLSSDKQHYSELDGCVIKYRKDYDISSLYESLIQI
ncbi:MAG: hypothetical protein MHPSP_000153, partial [Paramarteilia canceri]